MADCCRSRCSCVVTAGEGITIEGNGSSSVPYVITGQGAAGQTALLVTDTETVDLSLAGDGSAGAPYQVSADLKLDPAPPGGGTQLLQSGPDGLSLECADVRGCLTAGDGVGYDPATGVITTRLSADPGNTTEVGTDGGLFTPAPAGAEPTALQVTDSPTVNLTLAGTGTAADPYDVTAAVSLDPTPPGGGTQLLQSGPDGLSLECADVRGCLTAGDGVGYDPATGVITTRLSADPGNTTEVGTDGGLYTPAGGGGEPTALGVTDSTTLDLTVSGTGTAADPYDITGTVALDPTPPGGGTNLIQSGPDGLFLECAEVRGCVSPGDGVAYDPADGEVSARLSADAGNTIEVGTDGGLLVPAPDLPVVGCGLTGDGTAGAPITANPIAGEAEWAARWDCDPTLLSTLKCDPTTGALWTPPEHTSSCINITQNYFTGTLTQGVTPGWVILDPDAWSQSEYTAGSFSTCRGVSWATTFTGHADISWIDGSVFELGYALDINGGGPAVKRMNSQLTPLAAGQRLHSFSTHHAAALPRMTGGVARVYPAMRVAAGSVTVQQWITETLLTVQTR